MTADASRRRRMSATVYACVAMVFAVYAGWLILDVSGPRTVKVVAATVSTVVPATTAALAFLAARGSTGRVRAAWTALGVGMSSFRR